VEGGDDIGAARDLEEARVERGLEVAGNGNGRLGLVLEPGGWL